MKRKLLLAICLSFGTFSFAQFTTGTVTLAGSTRTLKIDTNATTVTMTLTGPSNHWLGVGFGGFSMFEATDMFIWNSTANRDYTPSGQHSIPSADSAGSQSWTISSDNVAGNVRTVVATRPLTSTGDFTFLNNNSAIPIIFAEGSTTTLAYHSTNPHDSQLLTRTSLGVEDFSLNASTIFPNPSNGTFTVKTKTNLEKVNVYSQTGAFVKAIEVNGNPQEVQIQLDGLATGVYLIELQNASEKSWKKIMIK